MFENEIENEMEIEIENEIENEIEYEIEDLKGNKLTRERKSVAVKANKIEIVIPIQSIPKSTFSIRFTTLISLHSLH